MHSKLRELSELNVRSDERMDVRKDRHIEELIKEEVALRPKFFSNKLKFELMETLRDCVNVIFL